MNKKKKLQKKNTTKPKKIGLLFNKVFDDFKKKQKNNEKKEIRLREELIKKDQIKIKTKEKDLRIHEDELKKKINEIQKITDSNIGKIDTILEAKKNDILKV